MSGCCDNKSGKKSVSKTPEPSAPTATGNNPIEQLDAGSLVLLSDGEHSQHGYLLGGKYHDIHGRVIENFKPTHYFL